MNKARLIVLFLLFSTQLFSQKFSKQEVLQDLEYLEQSLEQTHYDLFAYTSQEEFSRNTAQVRAAVKQDSISFLQAVNLSQRIISAANTGHAEIDFPVSSYIEHARKGGKLFPLELALEKGKALIRQNFSDNPKLSKGAEVLSINGKSMESILESIYPQLSAERLRLKNAKLEFWSFPRLYWQVFGAQETYDVEVRDPEGAHSYAVAGITVMEFEEKRQGEILTTNREFRFFEDIAYLNPGPFSSAEENGEAMFKIFIDSAFAELKKRDSEVLIIDLRNNSGGHNAYSDHLVSYFADKPFKWHSSFSLKTSEILKEQTRKYNDTTEKYFKRILDEPSGSIYDYSYEAYQPMEEDKRFKGTVYVLINRQTYSMAAVTAALVQDYGFAEIVGEETGDLPSLHASQFSYTLPNTGIVVKVPKGYMVRPNKSEKLKGVIPNIKIKDHLLDEQDEILDTLLEKLKIGY